MAHYQGMQNLTFFFHVKCLLRNCVHNLVGFASQPKNLKELCLAVAEKVSDP